MLRPSEWVVVAYFAYLLATAVLVRAQARAVLRLIALTVLTCGSLLIVAGMHASRVGAVLRDWLPGAYVMAGYWATGLLYRRSARVESWLAGLDRRLFPNASRDSAVQLPHALREMLEFAYLFCYPLVPTGMAVIYATGQRYRADAYWTLVIAAAFAAYGFLPWAGTRPPRSLDTALRSPTRPPYLFQRVNLAVLAHGSIQVNTFPSGHAASAWAVALFMTTVSSALWPVFVAFAAAISVGAVVGRYHYALDVVLGTAVAVAGFVLM